MGVENKGGHSKAVTHLTLYSSTNLMHYKLFNLNEVLFSSVNNLFYQLAILQMRNKLHMFKYI